MFFDELVALPPDPILGLVEQFKADPRAGKIDLSVGVYQNDAGRTERLESVVAAERKLLEHPRAGYLGIAGDGDYLSRVKSLVFGGLAQTRAGEIVTLQTPGGTGALRVAADFLAVNAKPGAVWISSPSWPNHRGVFEAAGHNVQEHPYWTAETRSLDLDAMTAVLAKARTGDVVVLHGCCHNPTGVDPTPEQWDRILEVVSENNLIPLVDFAYQGFAEGLQADAAVVAKVLAACPEAFVANSFSKNFGLYGDRVGALSYVGGGADAVLSRLKQAVRTNYSNPPAHGAQVVATILAGAELRRQWEGELTEMHDRISDMRSRLVTALQQETPDRDWSFLQSQRGMFSYSGLTPEQVQTLREEHAVYIVRSGRMNVAGINSGNIDRLVAAVAAVCR